MSKKKWTIEDMQDFAKPKGGKCLSVEYINARTKLKWRCSKGHEWEATPESIKNQHSWCPYCANNVKLTIEEMQKLAALHNGECLSTEYIDVKTKLLWRCSEGHEWFASPDCIKNQDSWCPTCARKRQANKKRGNIEEMWALARFRGGECISKEYKNANTKLLWRCKEGHEWNANANSIKGGSWCPVCARKTLANKQKGNINEIQALAQSRGGICLSTEYVNVATKLLWRCEEGHKWKATPNNVKRGNWCPICSIEKRADKMRDNIQNMKALAQSRGGICLSTEYVNANTKLLWRCEEGHKWESSPSNIKRGSWCPICSKKKVGEHRRGSIEEMQKLAISMGGECLSKKYESAKTKLLWRCAKGHEWKSTPTNIKNGSWCPYCGITKRADKQRGTIEEMQKIAKSKNGKCLSSEYIDFFTKLRWQCKKGHKWESIPANIKKGSWCPYCAISERADKQRGTIEEIQEIARLRGGECLSTQYINRHMKLQWQCAEGHEWEANSDSIIRGHWCPICSQGINERICRIIFEKIFRKKFPKKRPDWLINPVTGKRLELDGYCEDLSIAFEFQGVQHYKNCEDFFHRNRSFKEQNRIDQLKRDICKQKGIKLIEIPYNKTENIGSFIIRECNRNGIETGQVGLDIFDYGLLGVYGFKKLENVQELARARGGECLSTKYVKDNLKLKLRCSKGHEWITSPNNIKAGKWCQKCSRNKTAILDEIHFTVAYYGGKCLNSRYVNMNNYMQFQCREGHNWSMTLLDLRRGNWCPYCNI